MNNLPVSFTDTWAKENKTKNQKPKTRSIRVISGDVETVDHQSLFSHLLPIVQIKVTLSCYFYISNLKKSWRARDFHVKKGGIAGYEKPIVDPHRSDGYCNICART